MQVSTGSKLLLSRSRCPGESEPSPMTLGKDLRRRDDAIFVQIVFVLTGYYTGRLRFRINTETVWNSEI